MSIQLDRRKSLKLGRFIRLEEVDCDFLNLCYIQRYVYASTKGRLFREKPLLSLKRWCNPRIVTLRNLHIKNRRLFI